MVTRGSAAVTGTDTVSVPSSSVDVLRGVPVHVLAVPGHTDTVAGVAPADAVTCSVTAVAPVGTPVSVTVVPAPDPKDVPLSTRTGSAGRKAVTGAELALVATRPVRTTARPLVSATSAER
jgi:hypothetical protein